MNETLKEQISALVDGELEGPEQDRIIRQIEQDPQLQHQWERYNLISDALNSHLTGNVRHNLAARVSDALVHEPIVFAPQRKKKHVKDAVKHVAGMAVAASVAVVVVLSVQPEAPVTSVQSTQVATVPAPNDWVRVSGTHWDLQSQPAVESKLNSYLVNHSEYTLSTGMQGVIPYVRIVGYDAE